jgi:competence protein ComEC
MPLGLEHWPLQLLGWGIELMLAAGRWVAHLPGAVSIAPAFPIQALAVVALGGLWLAIWRRRWRWLGLAPMLLGLALMLTARPPDLLMAADAQTVAVRGPDGLLHFLRPPKDKYAAADWLKRDGDGRAPADAVGAGFIHCDASGCIAEAKSTLIAQSWRARALAEDCARADLVISTAALSACPHPRLALDAKAAVSAGGYALFLPGLTGQSVRQARGDRPWVSPP